LIMFTLPFFMQDMYNIGWSVWCTYGYCKGGMAVVLRGLLNDGVGRGCHPDAVGPGM